MPGEVHPRPALESHAPWVLPPLLAPLPQPLPSPSAQVSIDRNSPDFIAWEDINGIDSVKREIEEIIDYLKNPSLLSMRGISRIGGVMLAGAPGTGKTLLAKAIAAESGVRMFTCSGTDFFDVRRRGGGDAKGKGMPGSAQLVGALGGKGGWGWGCWEVGGVGVGVPGEGKNRGLGGGWLLQFGGWPPPLELRMEPCPKQGTEARGGREFM